MEQSTVLISIILDNCTVREHLRGIKRSENFLSEDKNRNSG